MVYDRDGKFLGSWGEGVFTAPHGITIGPDDVVYCTDDSDHTVRKFTPDGKLLLTTGHQRPGRRTPATTASTPARLQRGGGPVQPADEPGRGADGELYVSDGYGNARVHRFSRRRRR